MAEPQAGERRVRRTLAETLAARAGQAPHPPGDLATSVIARAHRVRRRRRALGLAALLVGTVSAGGVLAQALPPVGPGGGYTGMFWDTASPHPRPTQPSPDPRPDERPERSDEAVLAADPAVTTLVSTDVIGQSQAGGLLLATADGRTERLGSVPAVSSAHRVSDGWAVVGGEPGTARLWWVDAEGGPQAVLSGMDAITVGQHRVAWRRGTMLSTAVLSASGDLEQRADTRAPDGGGEPVGFLGEAVLLRRDGSGGATAWDVWLPVRGDYRPGWTEEVVRVYGVEPGGDSAIGLAAQRPGEDHLCLVRLRIGHSLDVAGRTCLPDLPVLGPAGVSPRGDWLVGTASDGGATRVVVVDLAVAFGGDPAGAGTVVNATGAGAITGRPVWLGADQAVLPATGSLVRLRPALALAAQPEGVSEGVPEGVEVITLSGDPPVLVQGN